MIRIIFIGFMSVVLLSGCASSRKYGAGLSLSFASADELGMEIEEIKSKEYIDKIYLKNRKIPADYAISYAIKENTPEMALAVGSALINNSDAACEAYMANSIAQSNWVTSSLSVSNIALSTAASVATPARSANLLGGLSSLADGTETRLTERVLDGAAPHLIYRSVMSARERERTALTLLLVNPRTAQSALNQLASYHSLCGVTVGINELNSAVDEAEKQASDKGEAIGKKRQDDTMKAIDKQTADQ